MTDQELLIAYQQSRDKARFGEIVQRFINLVYSVARRHVKDPHLAQDVTQEVFLAFYRAAPRVDPKTPLAGWFFTTTRQISLQTLRGAARRRRREQEVAMSEHATTPPPTDAAWAMIANDVDAAVASLSRQERDVLVLRYFAGKTHQEIADDLSISTEAASKRVQRALAALRELLTSRGMMLSEASLAAALAHALAQPAPAALAGAVTHAAFGVTSTSLIKGALVASTKVKLAIVATTAALIFVPAAVITVEMHGNGAPPPTTAAPVATETTDPMEEFNSIYRLEPDEVVRRIAPPYIASRVLGFRTINTSGMNGNGGATPTSMFMRWRDGETMVLRSASWGSSFTVYNVVSGCMRVTPQTVTGDSSLLLTRVPGDLILRDNAPQQKIAEELSKILSDSTGRKVLLEFRDVQKSAYILRGQWSYQPLPQISPRELDKSRPLVEIYGNQRNTELPHRGNGSVTVAGLAAEISAWIGTPVFIEAEGVPNTLGFENENYDPGDPASAAAAKKPQAVLDHLAQQTGLKWSEETRSMHTLFVEYAK